MKSVVLLFLFIVSAVFLTAPERKSDYRQEKLDVYLGEAVEDQISDDDLMSMPSISVTRANIEGDFEVTLRKLDERTEIPRGLKKYLNKDVTFNIPNPICNFMEASRRILSCSMQNLVRPNIAETFSNKVKVQLLGLSSGILSGQYPNAKGELQSGDVYMIRVSLQVGQMKRPLDFQFLTSPQNVTFKSIKKQLIVSQ